MLHGILKMEVNDMDAWDYLEEADYYLQFDPMWDETFDYIIMLPEVGEEL